MKKALLTTLLFALTGTFAHAGPQFLNIEGQLFEDAAGITPVESSSVSVILEVLSPGPSECVLYKESHTLNMLNSQGYFSLQLGSGAQSGANYEDVNNMADAFDNSIGTITPTTCVVGPNYTPSVNDGRQLRVSYNSGTGLQTLTQNIQFGSTAFALSAGSIDGLSSSDLLTINTGGSYVLTQANLDWIFANASRYAELQALLNGTSTQYSSSSPTGDVSMNSQKIVDVANPTLATDAANKQYTDGNIGGQAADTVTMGGLGAGQSGNVMVWNGTQWTASAPAGDSTKLPLAGGTMTGALNMGANAITSSGSVTAASLSANNIAIYNGANYKGFQAPVGAPNILWTLPSADGTSGQVLQTNGSGVLSFVNMPAASVASASNQNAGGVGVFKQLNATDLEFRGVNAASTKVTVSLDAGNNEIDVDVNEANFNLGLIPNTPAGTIAAANAQSAINELDSEKVAKAGDVMTGALTMNAQNEVRFADSDSSNYVGFMAPATVGGDMTWVLPDADGGAGHVLQTDGAGNLSFVAPSGGGISAATNVGAGGADIFKQDNAGTLEFNGINDDGNGKIVVTQDVGNNEIDLSVDESNLDPAAIPNTPAGNIAATNLQAAIDELDFEMIRDVTGSALADSQIWVGNAGSASEVSLAGDVSMVNTGVVTISNDAITSVKILNDTIVDADINTAANINATKLATGVVDNTEFNYLNGVTSAIQTQVDGKINDTGDTMTGQLLIDGGSDQVQLAIEGDAAQSANLLEVRNSASTVVASISYDGTVSSGTNLATKTYVDGAVSAVAVSADSLDWDDFGDAMTLDATATIDMDTNAADFNFDSNTLYIDSSANRIGLGTSTPVTKLDVEGTIQIGDSGETCSIAANGGLIRYWGTDLQYCNGSSWQTLGVSGAGLTSLNGLTSGSQTFSTGSTGPGPNFSSAGSVHTLNIPLASGAGVTSGTISKGDYDIFAAKLDSVAGAPLADSYLWVGNGVGLAQAVSMSGDVTMSNSGATTIANNMVDSGKIADNTIVDADINASASIARSKMAPGTANTLVINNGSGVLSESAAISPNRALASDASGLPTASSTTVTELGYLSGVTSAIQAQIDGKQSDLGFTPVSNAGGTMSGDLIMTNNTGLALAELTGNGLNNVRLLAPAMLGADYTLTLPADDGNPGQFLQTDGAGLLSWASAGTGDILNNGNSFAAPMTLGTNDNNDLQFETNGSPRMVISSIGNIGLGVPSPSFKFHAREASSNVTTIAVENQTNSLTSGAEFLARNNNGEVAGFGISPLLNSNTAIGNGRSYFYSDASNGSALWSLYGGTRFFTGVGGTERMILTDGGWIGIGTSTPDVQLDVNNGTINAAALCDENNANCKDLSTGWSNGDILNGGNNGAVIIGSNDNSLSLKSNNVVAVTVSPSGNLGVGTNSPSSMLDVNGDINIASAAKFRQGGFPIMFATANNTALGANALASSNTNNFNTAIGQNAFQTATTGNYSVAVGALAASNGNSNNGVFVGYQAGRNVTGASNTVVGINAMRSVSSSTNNTIVGANAMELATSGSGNVIVGRATSTNDNGSNNVVIGHLANSTGTSGSNNILIGYSVEKPTSTLSNFLNIGNSIYGDLAAGNIGIGTDAPLARLDVDGPMRLRGVLKLDSLGSVDSPCGGFTNGDLTRDGSGQLLQCDGTNWKKLNAPKPAFIDADNTINFGMDRDVTRTISGTCGGIDFENIKDGGEYVFVLTVMSASPCTFAFWDGLTSSTILTHYFENGQDSTHSASQKKMYRINRIVNDVYVTVHPF